MRAVIDTNILVRALLRPRGAVGMVLPRLRHGEYVVLYSQALLDELVDVLNRSRIRQKYHIAEEDIAAVVRLVLLRGEAITPTVHSAMRRDPKNDKLLDVAVAGRANVIVSADRDLLTMPPFSGIPIVSSGAFLQKLDSERMPGTWQDRGKG
jgi:putative PIN family toxin of toxin-antitoxin system